MSAAQNVPLFSMFRPSTSFNTLSALSSAFSSPTLISASGLPMARRTFLHMSVSTCTGKHLGLPFSRSLDHVVDACHKPCFLLMKQDMSINSRGPNKLSSLSVCV